MNAMSQQQSGSLKLREIYNLLLAGKVLQMHFATRSAAETFRVAMFRYKRIQDQAMISLGLMEEEEKQVFSFVWSAESCSATAQFSDARPHNKTYSFVVLETPAGKEEKE